MVLMASWLGRTFLVMGLGSPSVRTAARQRGEDAGWRGHSGKGPGAGQGPAAVPPFPSRGPGGCGHLPGPGALWRSGL